MTQDADLSAGLPAQRWSASVERDDFRPLSRIPQWLQNVVACGPLSPIPLSPISTMASSTKRRASTRGSDEETSDDDVQSQSQASVAPKATKKARKLSTEEKESIAIESFKKRYKTETRTNEEVLGESLGFDP